MDDINPPKLEVDYFTTLWWLLGLPHFDSKSWDWWVPITEMPQFFTAWLMIHAIGKQMVYRLCPWNVLYGKSYSCWQSGHVLVNFPIPFQVGQLGKFPLIFGWLLPQVTSFSLLASSQGDLLWSAFAIQQHIFGMWIFLIFDSFVTPIDGFHFLVFAWKYGIP